LAIVETMDATVSSRTGHESHGESVDKGPRNGRPMSRETHGSRRDARQGRRAPFILAASSRARRRAAAAMVTVAGARRRRAPTLITHPPHRAAPGRHAQKDTNKSKSGHPGAVAWPAARRGRASPRPLNEPVAPASSETAAAAATRPPRPQLRASRTVGEEVAALAPAWGNREGGWRETRCRRGLENSRREKGAHGSPLRPAQEERRVAAATAAVAEVASVGRRPLSRQDPAGRAVGRPWRQTGGG